MAASPCLRIASTGGEEDGDECNTLEQQICHICLTQFARYTCPRCNICYCSVLCYKSEKHTQCSESFYRECFMTELQQRKGSPEEKHQMLEILKKLEERREDDVGEGGRDTRSLEERLAGLDLEKETDVVWQQLTPSEQREFQEIVMSGKMGHLLPVYTPWWEVARNVVSLESPESDQSCCSIPDVLSNLPPIDSLIKGGNVSPHIHYSILNVLYAYAYTVRLFNGGHHELPLQASQAMLDVSDCLSSSASFCMAGEALQQAMASVQQKRDLFNSAEFSASVLMDVCHLLCNPKSHDCCVTHALSDLHRLFGAARTQLKCAEKGVASPGAWSRQLWLTRKKLVFLTSWANENFDFLIPLTRVVELEYETVMSEVVMQRKTESELKQTRRERGGDTDKNHDTGHKLIEELN